MMISQTWMKLLESFLPSFIYAQIDSMVNSKQGREFILTVCPVLMTLAILTVYFYWNLVVLPEMFEKLEYSGIFWFLFCYGGGAFLFHGVCGHYYFIVSKRVEVTPEDMVGFSYDIPAGFDVPDKAQDEDTTSCMTAFDKLGLPPPSASKEWHPCFICRSYVCPDAYHCTACKTCIRRRDHHCIFAKNCIGQDNIVNFVGFLVYLLFGTAVSLTTGLILEFEADGVKCFLEILKPAGAILGILLGSEKLVRYALIQLTFIGLLISTTCLIKYVQMCARGQTCFDLRREAYLNLAPLLGSRAKFEHYLGPNAWFKICFPLYPNPQRHFHDRRDFIRKFQELKEKSKISISIQPEQQLDEGGANNL